MSDHPMDPRLDDHYGRLGALVESAPPAADEPKAAPIPPCDLCGRVQTVKGAILWGPPDERSLCLKTHVCVGCYGTVIATTPSVTDLQGLENEARARERHEILVLGFDLSDEIEGMNDSHRDPSDVADPRRGRTAWRIAIKAYRDAIRARGEK